ncbi:dihydrofolate reductase family protein [Jiangella endophytica]|uniref:dihydrofolate reductase family protein n=1 Tax=Jiangella endophytica TaxID=1623398 RepID=UPI000E354494|nr:dihydrofolate reductase family protein [Jiangella endophytica]
MRKLKLQVQVTADGYMGGPNGEMDWTTSSWTDDLTAYLDEVQHDVDTIVLGRKLAEGFIPAWASRPEGETDDTIDWMNNTSKVVASNTLTEPPWENAVIARGDVADSIGRLKAQDGGEIITYGGSTLVAALIANQLVDELNLIVNPTSIGTGLPVFPRDGYQRFDLAHAQRFECGMAALRYQRTGADA